MYLEDIDDDSYITEDLIDMRNNCGIQMEFSNGNLEHFRASQMETYPVLAKKLSMCWCLSQQLTCAKQDFPACFTSNQRREINCILSTTCE